MESGHPSLGLEGGTTDVECLLVEPQDEHLSMDSVICFSEKISKNAMSTEDVSRSSGGTDTGIAHEGRDIHNGEVLHAMSSEVEVGYFRLENDLCSMGEEYLLGVEFAESIRNLDYGSSEGLHASVSDSHVQGSTAGSDTGCRSDIFRTEYPQDCRIDSFSVRSSQLSDSSHCRECETLSGENPSLSLRSCTLQNSVKSQNSSSSSCQDIMSDENGGRFSHASEMFCSPKTERNNDNELTVENVSTRVIKVDTLSTPVKVSSTDVLPTGKRSRKPTQRYICELVDPICPSPERRREVSSSTIKNKSPGVKDRKKCQTMGAKAIQESPEEFSAVAIQVPFGSLANKECPQSHASDSAQLTDCRNSIIKSKGKYAVDLMRRGHYIREGQSKNKNGHAIATNQKKRNDCGNAVIRKKRDERCTREEDGSPAAHQKISSDSLTSESGEETSGRRKHHRLWTIAEVRKLIDGVSQYGVGRWSRIKKLFFSASAHRTSVDLKDKWRNLLKASGMQEQGSGQGEKKRSVAWRPLPKAILRRVCELAAVHPYPKGQRTKAKTCRDAGADVTLNDYRRSLRSLNGN